MADLIVVDDDHDLGDILADILRSRGHEIRVARSGHEALQLVAERRPEAVVLDVEMPVLSGPDTAHLLLIRNCGDEEIPIVLLSGIVDLRRVAARVGTPYFLAKPYELEAIVQLVARALAERTPPTPAGKP
jgi:DNA-binding NtrC family response regulator